MNPKKIEKGSNCLTRSISSIFLCYLQITMLGESYIDCVWYFRWMEVWPLSKVFDLFSRMVQGLYSAYLYVQGFVLLAQIWRLTYSLHFLIWLNYIYIQGTGSAGATVRIYVEQFEPDVSKHDTDAQVALKPLIGMSVINFVFL